MESNRVQAGVRTGAGHSRRGISGDSEPQEANRMQTDSKTLGSVQLSIKCSLSGELS